MFTTVSGTWRSLVARFAGGEEVAGSNPVVPTICFRCKAFVCKWFAYRDAANSFVVFIGSESITGFSGSETHHSTYS